MTCDSLLASLPEGTRRVLCDVLAERERQDVKWGGPEHDDGHGWHFWIDYIIEHARKAYSPNDDEESYANGRRRYIEVAALALAAVESMDRTVLRDASVRVRYWPYRSPNGGPSALARRFPYVRRQEVVADAAERLNAAMVAWHHGHAMPEEFLREHLELTTMLAPPKETL